ncbi:unnamed protein product, partial [Symbiodinium necroappetens]
VERKLVVLVEQLEKAESATLACETRCLKLGSPTWWPQTPIGRRDQVHASLSNAAAWSVADAGARPLQCSDLSPTTKTWCQQILTSKRGLQETHLSPETLLARSRFRSNWCLTGPRNAQILGHLVSYVRELPEPWVIGRLIATGEITCTQGAGAVETTCGHVTLAGKFGQRWAHSWAKALETCRNAGATFKAVVTMSIRCIIKLQSELNTSTWEQTQGDATKVDGFLRKGASSPEATSFIAEVIGAFEQRQASLLGPLRAAAEAKEAEAQVEASRVHFKQYKAWLCAGMVKGMRPLFRSLSKAEQ